MVLQIKIVFAVSYSKKGKNVYTEWHKQFK